MERIARNSVIESIQAGRKESKKFVKTHALFSVLDDTTSGQTNRDHLIFQRWKRRYFRLKPRRLYYAKDSKVSTQALFGRTQVDESASAIPFSPCYVLLSLSASHSSMMGGRTDGQAGLENVSSRAPQPPT